MGASGRILPEYIMTIGEGVVRDGLGDISGKSGQQKYLNSCIFRTKISKISEIYSVISYIMLYLKALGRGIDGYKSMYRTVTEIDFMDEIHIKIKLGR